MSKKLLMEIKLSETGCNSIPMGLEYRFCHSIETHLKRKKSLLNYTTLKISEYANEYLSNYEDGIRSMKYDLTVEFFEKRQLMVDDALSMFNYCEGLIEHIKVNMANFIKQNVILDVDGEWSFLNKLNTNHSALAYVITKLRFDVDNSFDTETIVHRFFDYDETGVSPFMNFVNSVKPNMKSEVKKIMVDMFNTIKASTDYGNKAEETVKKLLLNEYEGSEIKDFTGDYSFIDMMGIDISIKIDGKWIPVQIKSNPEYCRSLGNVGGCENWCVSSRGKKLIVNKY